ncbi:unnamed protein product [Closterium sp. NIES-53]
MEAHERQLRAVGEDSKQLMAVIRSMQSDLQSLISEYSKGLPSSVVEGQQRGEGQQKEGDSENVAEEEGRGSENGSEREEEVEEEEEENMVGVYPSAQVSRPLRFSQPLYSFRPFFFSCRFFLFLERRLSQLLDSLPRHQDVYGLVERAEQQQAASAAAGGDCTGGDSNEMAALREELEACRERLAEQESWKGVIFILFIELLTSPAALPSSLCPCFQELLICNYMHTPGSATKTPLIKREELTPLYTAQASWAR